MHPVLAQDEYFGRVLRSLRAGPLAITETAYAPGDSLPEHVHAHAYLCLVTAGAFREEGGDDSRDCLPGTVLLHRQDEVHADRFGARGGRCLNVALRGPWFERRSAVLLGPQATRAASSVPLAAAVRRLHAAFLLGAADLEALVVELLGMLGRCRGAGAARRPRWLARVEQRLADETRPSPALDELASQAGVHPMHMTRAFQLAHGCSIGQWLRARRVEAAARELVETEFSLAEVALRNGFCDQSHFNRVFRKVAGTSPGKYRAGARSP